MSRIYVCLSVSGVPASDLLCLPPFCAPVASNKILPFSIQVHDSHKHFVVNHKRHKQRNNGVKCPASRSSYLVLALSSIKK